VGSHAPMLTQLASMSRGRARRVAVVDREDLSVSLRRRSS
jgi:hypothetical protein